MDTLHGIKIKRQDLKKEGDNYLFFKQLEEMRKKNGQSAKVELTDRLYDQYDSLLISPEDDIQGLIGEKLHPLETIKGSFAAAQTLFSE